MNQPVTLVLWRDAKTDPPKRSRDYETGFGVPLFYDTTRKEWGERDELLGDWYPAMPQPSVWCELTPPGDDPLTVDDLRYTAEILERVSAGKEPTPGEDVATLAGILARHWRRVLADAALEKA